MVRASSVVLALAFLAGAPAPAFAQDAKPGCTTTAPSTPATPSGTGASGAGASGTAPSQMGTTGWSGGTGGSYIGTVPQGSTPSSQSEQPTTASGLDPTKSTSTNPSPQAGC